MPNMPTAGRGGERAAAAGGDDDFPLYYFGAGGGGGSFIDPSAMAILAEVAGIASPLPPNYNPYGGEIIITEVPEPASASLLAIGSLALLRRRVRCGNVEPAVLGS